MECLPVVYGRPASCAALNSNGEYGEEEEEARHAKTDLVDGRVADQSAAVLSGVQLFTNHRVIWNLKPEDTELPLVRENKNTQ